MAGKIVKNLDNALLVQLAGIFVIIGHTFPVFFKFKGGKGIATALGVLLMINWQIGLICLIFALVLMALTKMVSVGSIAAAILFPILVAFIDQNYIVQTSNSNWSYLVFSIIVALLVIFNHRANVQRILNGTENRLSFKNRKERQMKNICIIGSGSWGCALAIHAAKMGHNVKIWSFAQEEANLINKERKCMFLPMATIPENIYCTTDIKRSSRRFRLDITCYTIKIL